MEVTRAALLIDGDNISIRHDATLKREAQKIGRLDVTRVYGGPCVSAEWLTTPGIRFMQAGTGKNAADLLLSIDAMELAFSGGIDAFAIASSDGDFTHLAQRLREKGHHVTGLGDARAPERFRTACHEFRLLNDQQSCEESTQTPEENIENSASTEFDGKIRCVIAKNSVNGQGIVIEDLSRWMRQEHNTRISTFPEQKWRKYLEARSELFALDPKGPGAKVRFLPAGFAGR